MTWTERLAGKVAVVTGCGSGIGMGCARMFPRHGARVIGVDIDPAAAGRTRAAAEEGLEIEIETADLTDPEAVSALMERIGARHGRIDLLVNAAAVADFVWIEEMEFQRHWRRTLAAELDSVFLTCKAAWPWLKVSGSSAIVNLASANAWVALKGSAALAHTAGKAGVLGMTRQLAMEGAPHGIRANTISPGMIVTGATAPVLDDPAFLAEVKAKLMLDRLGQPEDIALMAVYLGSDEAGYVTGADFRCDGGALAW